MCGRFTQLLNWQQVHYLYEIPAIEVPPLLQPRYNGAPTQDFALCRMSAESERTVGLLRWGLVPFWAKDISNGSRKINARAETVREKPSFRRSFKSRRCLIPVDGWFEWPMRTPFPSSGSGIPGTRQTNDWRPLRLLRPRPVQNCLRSITGSRQLSSRTTSTSGWIQKLRRIFCCSSFALPWRVLSVYGGSANG